MTPIITNSNQWKSVIIILPDSKLERLDALVALLDNLTLDIFGFDIPLWVCQPETILLYIIDDLIANLATYAANDLQKLAKKA